MDIPVLVARGLLEDSLISNSDIELYKRMCTNLIIKQYPASGHDLKGHDKERFYNDILTFINDID